MHQPKHIELIFLLAVFLSFSFITQSMADNSPKLRVFSEQEINLHQQRMKNMSAEERNNYRNQQYQFIRQRAEAIGYSMPEAPPWAGQEPKAEATTSPDTAPNDTDDMQNEHMKQLSAYRKEAAEKRQIMRDKIEKQRQKIQERIDKLVEKNAVKPTRPAALPRPPVAPPAPAAPPVPAFQPAPYTPYAPYGMPAYPYYRY